MLSLIHIFSIVCFLIIPYGDIEPQAQKSSAFRRCFFDAGGGWAYSGRDSVDRQQFVPVQQAVPIAEDQLADDDAEHRRGEDIARKVDVQVQPRGRDERRERNGRITKASVCLRQDCCTDDRRERVARGCLLYTSRCV